MIDLFKSKKHGVFIALVMTMVGLAALSLSTQRQEVREETHEQAPPLLTDAPPVTAPMQDAVVEAADVTLPDVRAMPLIIAIPEALRVVGVRCDLSSALLLDVLLDEGLSDCDDWEQVVKIHGQFATLPPDAMLVVEPRARGVEALSKEIIAWHEEEHAMIRLDCSSPDLPSNLRHIECDAPIGDMIALSDMPHLESLALRWSREEEARIGMESMGEDYDAFIKQGKELPYHFDNFSMIGQLKTLKRLWLDPSGLDGDRLGAILNLEELTWLELISTSLWGGGPAISGSAWISSIGKLPHLRTLKLNGSALADSDLVYLTDLKELRALSLNGLQRDCAPNDHLGRHLLFPGDRSHYPCRRREGDISFLKKLTQLEHLHLLSLKDTTLEGHFIKDLGLFKTLRVLSVQVDEAKQLRLGALSSLEGLSLWASEPTIPWVGCTLGYSSQERLDYFNQDAKPMTEFMVSWDPNWIAGVQTLRVLHVKNLKVSDGDARALSDRLERLRGLSIVDSSVHDAILAGAPITRNLKRLKVERACMTRARVNEVGAKLPERARSYGETHGSRTITHYALSASSELEEVRKEERPWAADYCHSAEIKTDTPAR